MSASGAIRLSGAALIAGAVLSIVTAVVGAVAFVGTDPTAFAGNALFVPVNLVSALGTALLLVALPVLYIAWHDRLGSLGLIGILLIFVTGLIFGIFLSLLSAVILPWLVQQSPSLAKKMPPGLFPTFLLGAATAIVGSVLLAIPIVRGRASRPWVGWVLIASAIFGVVGFAITGPSGPGNVLISLISSVEPVLLFIALGYIGYELWSPEAATVQAPLTRPQLG